MDVVEDSIVDEYRNKHKCLINDKRIDKYNYEANCEGCEIFDYDKYERHRNDKVMLLIGILGLYFFVGLILGIAM